MRSQPAPIAAAYDRSPGSLAAVHWAAAGAERLHCLQSMLHHAHCAVAIVD